MVFWQPSKPSNQVAQQFIIRFREKTATMVLFRNTQQDLFDIFTIEYIVIYFFYKYLKVTTQGFYAVEINFLKYLISNEIE